VTGAVGETLFSFPAAFVAGSRRSPLALYPPALLRWKGSGPPSVFGYFWLFVPEEASFLFAAGFWFGAQVFVDFLVAW